MTKVSVIFELNASIPALRTVSCPIIFGQYTENWGLDDPSGQSDEVFIDTIKKIEENVLQLKNKLSN